MYRYVNRRFKLQEILLNQSESSLYLKNQNKNLIMQWFNVDRTLDASCVLNDVRSHQ